MTINEVEDLLGIIANEYPKFSEGRDPETTLRTWHRILQSQDSQEVNAAALAWIASDVKGFPPTIAMILETLRTLKGENEEESEMEAWQRVRTALRNGYYGFEQEFAKLPEDIQQVLGSAIVLRDWAMIDEKTVDSVIASNFMRSYKAKAKYAREVRMLPSDVRALFIKAGDTFRLKSHQEENMAKLEAARCAAKKQDTYANYSEPPVGFFEEVRRKLN